MKIRNITALLLVLLLLTGCVSAAQDGADTQAPEQDAFAWWMIPVALGVFLLGGGGILLGARRKGRLHEMLQDAEQQEDDT